MSCKLIFLLICFITITDYSFAIKEDADLKKGSTAKETLNFSANEKGHILFFHNAGTGSHLITMKALAEGLVEHGHQVTSVWYAESKIKHNNFREILQTLSGVCEIC